MKLEAVGIGRIFFRNGHGTNYFHAVNATDFVLQPGKLTEIVGRSGSGKTTFLHMLSGLLTPSEGKVLLDGTDLYAMDDNRRSLLRNQHIGIIPQGQTGLAGLTVLENVLAPAAMYGGDPASRRQRASELLKLVGISDLEDVFANELSGGEVRRMSIARALINDPQIVMADEPTGDLDDENTEIVLQLLRAIAHEDGVAVLLVTHEKEAEAYADALYRMSGGFLTREEK